MIPKFVERHFAWTIVLLVAISRLPALFFPILTSGESDIAVQTVVWMKGGIPYVDFVEQVPLLIHTWYRSIFAIFGLYNMIAVHLMNIVLVLITIAGLYYIARYTSGEKVARWVALLYAFFQCFYSTGPFLAANTQTLMNACVVWGIYAFFTSMREDRPGMSLIAGALLGLAMLADPLALAVLPACGVSLVWFWHEQSVHKWHRYVEEFALLLIGVMFPLTIYLIYLADAGGFDAFFTWVVGSASRYAYNAAAPLQFMQRGFAQLLRFMAATSILWLLSIWIVIHIIRTKTWRVEVLFFAACIVFSLAAVWLDGRFDMAVFLLFLPALSMLGAIAVVGRWEPFLKGLKMSRQFRQRARIAAVVLVLGIPYVAFFALHVEQAAELREASAAARNLSTYIAEHSEPDDTVFVWGSNSELYFYSRRMPASRFVDAKYLSGVVPGYEFANDPVAHRQDFNAWIMLKSDFKRHYPRMIIDMAPTGLDGYGHFPIDEQLFLANYVSEYFTKGETVEGAQIYLRR